MSRRRRPRGYDVDIWLLGALAAVSILIAWIWALTSGR